MTIREENIKKINSELKKLTDEQLEQVAGSTIGQTSSDTKFLYDYGLMNSHYGTIPVTFEWISKSAKVDAGWAKAGITCVTKPFKDNQYFLNGKEISRGEAVAIVKKNFKRLYNVSSD